MSYDFSVVMDCGGPEPMSYGDLNYTYNVCGMFRKALGRGISECEGMLCSELLPLLNDGIGNMEHDPMAYAAMNPANGWGDSEGALNVLKTLRDWCIRFPKARLHIS